MTTKSRRAVRLAGELGDVALDVVGDGFAYPALRRRVSHPVAAEQHLLVGYRQPGDLPADRQPLEQELGAPPPGIVDRGGGAGRTEAYFPDRQGAQRLPQDEGVALLVAVLDGRDLLLRAPFPTSGHPPRVCQAGGECV